MRTILPLTSSIRLYAIVTLWTIDVFTLLYDILNTVTLLQGLFHVSVMCKTMKLALLIITLDVIAIFLTVSPTEY